MKLLKRIGFICWVASSAVSAVNAEIVSVEQTIREVSTNSDEVKRMREDLKKSKLVIKENWSAVYPKLSGSFYTGISRSLLFGGGGGTSVGITDEETSDNTFAKKSVLAKKKSGIDITEIMKDPTKPSNIYSSSASLSVNQTIYTFGKVGTALEVAKQYDSSIICNNIKGIQNLQLLALDGYYSAVLSEKNLSIISRSQDRKKEVYEFIDRNFKMGSGSKAQLLQAQADLKSSNPEMISASEIAKITKLNLAMMIGRDLSDSLQLDTTLTLPGLTSIVLPSKEDAVKAALLNRGDLHAINYLELAYRNGAKIYRAMYLPSIVASGKTGISQSVLSKDRKDVFNWSSDNVNSSVGIVLQWNLFDGFSNSSKANQYVTDAHKLSITKNSLLKLIEIEIESALSECIAADSNQQASVEILAAIKESYELTNDNFKQGSGQYVELQLAEERLHQAEIGILIAQYRVLRSRAALQVAMGREIVRVEE
jgi:outer membrane protein TolC